MSRNIQKKLFEMQDLGYKEFQSKLVPNLEADRIIGVRTPMLRKYAKELAGTDEAGDFLKELPHTYYEENNLHGFLLEAMKDYDSCIGELHRFLPYVDNWATCDSMAPKVFKKHLPELLEQIRIWMSSDHTYTIRFGIGMLMRFYLEDAFAPEYPDMVASVRSDEYYVNMMIAWYFATALAKQWGAVLPYIEEGRLDVWTHNKAIQKARESRRISDSEKEYLNGLKR